MSKSSALNVYNPDSPPLDERSLYLRSLVIRALKGGGRGHVGPALSMIEIFRALYDNVLRYNPKDPDWKDRDRCILSKGHGCLAPYVLLADKGFFPLKELDSFCRFDSILGGHPEKGKTPGIEASTGALGHGLSIGIGMAIAARIQQKDYRVFVIMGDGEINEGSVWEAAMCAGKHQLANLTAIIDYNKIQASGATRDVQDLEPLADKWRAFNFEVEEVDGHDISQLQEAFSRASSSGKPRVVICHTVKGKGISFMENDPEWHHKANLPEDVLKEIERELGACNA